MKFSFDSDVLIEFKHMEVYNCDQYIELKKILSEKLSNGTIIISKWVIRELERKDDGLATWLKSFPNAIIETTPDIERHVIDIANNYTGWIDHDGTQNKADPYVIACAIEKEAIVVTNERLKLNLQLPNQNHALKIPNICEDYRIRHVNLYGFLLEIGTF